MTRAEYILNRIITDEAKQLVQAMDDDNDGRVERREFVKHATKRLADEKLANEVFSALDHNADGLRHAGLNWPPQRTSEPILGNNDPVDSNLLVARAAVLEAVLLARHSLSKTRCGMTPTRTANWTDRN